MLYIIYPCPHDIPWKRQMMYMTHPERYPSPRLRLSGMGRHFTATLSETKGRSDGRRDAGLRNKRGGKRRRSAKRSAECASTSTFRIVRKVDVDVHSADLFSLLHLSPPLLYFSTVHLVHRCTFPSSRRELQQSGYPCATVKAWGMGSARDRQG